MYTQAIYGLTTLKKFSNLLLIILKSTGLMSRSLIEKRHYQETGLPIHFKKCCHTKITLILFEFDFAV